MKARQVFERLLHLQYRLDSTQPEESPQIYEDFDLAMEELQSLMGCPAQRIHDALNTHYDAYVRKLNGR